MFSLEKGYLLLNMTTGEIIGQVTSRDRMAALYKLAKKHKEIDYLKDTPPDEATGYFLIEAWEVIT